MLCVSVCSMKSPLDYATNVGFNQAYWLTVMCAALQVGHIGQAMPSLSTCSTDSRQDYVSTTDSRGPRGSRPPRRAAAVAALEHNHLVFGSPSPGTATDASPSPLVSPKHPHMHEVFSERRPCPQQQEDGARQTGMHIAAAAPVCSPGAILQDEGGSALTMYVCEAAFCSPLCRGEQI